MSAANGPAVLTYIRGPRPGIYFFTSGRLTALDRAPEPTGTAQTGQEEACAAEARCN